MKKQLSLLLLALLTLSLTNCKKTDDSPPTCDITYTYDSHIGSIITTNCSGGSCHSSGSGNPTFTSYAQLKPYLDNGKFKKEVVTDQRMPKGKTLAKADLNAIKCWVDGGYVEK